MVVNLHGYEPIGTPIGHPFSASPCRATDEPMQRHWEPDQILIPLSMPKEGAVYLIKDNHGCGELRYRVFKHLGWRHVHKVDVVWFCQWRIPIEVPIETAETFLALLKP